MSPMQAFTTGLFLLSLVISLAAAIHLYRDKYRAVLNEAMNPQRRKFLIAGVVSLIGVGAVGLKIHYDNTRKPNDDPLVTCSGWILKEKELKPDVCEPTPL